MNVSQRLRAAREACKLTQGQVAEILGIERSAYTYYETGRTSPGINNLARLAAVFKVDVQWFFGEQTEGPFLNAGEDVFSRQQAVNETGMQQLSKEERQLVAFYRMMRGEGKGEAVFAALRQVRDAAPPEEKKGDA